MVGHVVAGEVTTAPGGTLLIVGHHPSDLQTAISRGSGLLDAQVSS
jgi:hypothetical protein